MATLNATMVPPYHLWRHGDHASWRDTPEGVDFELRKFGHGATARWSARVTYPGGHTAFATADGMVLGPTTSGFNYAVSTTPRRAYALLVKALGGTAKRKSSPRSARAKKNPAAPTPGKWYRRLGTYHYLSKNQQAFASVEPRGAGWLAYAHDRNTGGKLCQQEFNDGSDAKQFIETCVDGRKNPSTSPARTSFKAAYRAHRAWDKRSIPFAEYDAATWHQGTPAFNAEHAHRAAKGWHKPEVTRLTWKRFPSGRLDAHLGHGAVVSVQPAPSHWPKGFVAVLDPLRLTGAPKYIDSTGALSNATSVGRTIVFPTESAAKLATSRCLLAMNRRELGPKAKLPGGR